ncbi:Protein of unknown function [Pyronema omphalodes CBS 100304]|uniref:Uncharacterized protein n=1 Tax=Pyronema omphalodes (strain CBS 100304) TaxID=1076935 RepID=U4KY84_PYROM|nr:Protein of unknown function [Pyronema omphalodes CBS 100304]
MQQVIRTLIFGVGILGVVIPCACFCLDKAKAGRTKKVLEKQDREGVDGRVELDGKEVVREKKGVEKEVEKLAEKLAEKGEEKIIKKEDSEKEEPEKEKDLPKEQDPTTEPKAKADAESEDKFWQHFLPPHYWDEGTVKKTMVVKATDDQPKSEMAQPKVEDKVSEVPAVESSDHEVSPTESPTESAMPSLEWIQKVFGELMQNLSPLLFEGEDIERKVPGAFQEDGEIEKTTEEELKTFENLGLEIIMSNSPEPSPENFEFPDVSIAFPGDFPVDEEITEELKVSKEVVSCEDLKTESVEPKTEQSSERSLSTNDINVTVVLPPSETEVVVEVKVVHEPELVKSKDPTAEQSMEICDEEIEPMAALALRTASIPKSTQEIIEKLEAHVKELGNGNASTSKVDHKEEKEKMD